MTLRTPAVLCDAHGCNRSFKNAHAFKIHKHWHQRAIDKQFTTAITASEGASLGELPKATQIINLFRNLQPHTQSWVASEIARSFSPR